MRKQSPNTYGFTTTPAAVSLARIAQEAKPKQKFIVVHSKNVVTGLEEVAVMIRKDALPTVKEGFTVLGDPVGKTNWGQLVSGFKYVVHTDKDARKLLNKAKADLQKLKNYCLNRVVRVQVEAI